MRFVSSAAGLAVGIAVSILLLSFTARGSQQVAVVTPDNEGALAEVVIQFDARALDLFRETYEDLLRGFAAETTVTVVCRDAAEWDLFRESLLEPLPRPQREALLAACQPLFTGNEITPWSRDRYILADNLGTRVLLAPLPEQVTDPAREHEFAIPDLLAGRGPDITVYRPPFRFDGGDFTASRTVLYGGGGLLPKNGGRYRNPGVLREALAGMTGMKVILLGEHYAVPEHHVGMFITPLDDRTVLVADPLLARHAAVPQGLQPDFSEETMERFANLQRRLREEDLRVIPVPIIPFANKSVYVTYNNVVLETRGTERIVYLPVYGIDELDRMAAALYEREGFTVHPVRVGKVYRLGGSVRCLVNVLERAG